MNIRCAHAITLAALALAAVRLGAQQPAPGPSPDERPQAEAAKQAEAVKQEGDRLAKAGQYAAALEAYSRAIQIDPKFAAAYKSMGMAHRRLRQLENAIQDYGQAIEIDPADAEAYVERGSTRLMLRKIDAAIEDFDAAIEKKPDYARAYAARSGAKSQSGDKQGAAEDMAKARSLGFTMRIRVGGNVQQAKLIYQPRPVYPPEAKKAGITGVVRMDAIIGKDGTIQDLSLVSGDPALAPAALEAVQQWVYHPTLLNGAPVEVVTQIDVTFTLSRK